MTNRTTKVQNYIRIQQQICQLFSANLSYCTQGQKCADYSRSHGQNRSQIRIRERAPYVQLDGFIVIEELGDQVHKCQHLAFSSHCPITQGGRPSVLFVD